MITISHVKKRFGSVVALDDVSLSIGQGENVAFVGSNGSGKTTLLRALLGLIRVEGTITIGGTDVAKAPEVALRHVAYIPQIAPPIDAPVAEVVRAHAALRGKDVDATYLRAERLGLHPDTCRTKRFRDLSGGMKQKLLAAMALAAEAPVLVCDEPTANLDGAARDAFFEQLAERPSSSIVVLCSHRSDEVRTFVDRVVELGEGRIRKDGSVTELFAGSGNASIERPGIERRAVLVGLAGLMVAACSKADGPTDPVWGKEACAHCNMLVGDKRYAGQAISNGDRRYFDDIGCMVEWLKDHKAEHLWVRDAGENRWLEASKARYVSGAKTPMDFGFEGHPDQGISWEEMQKAVLSRKDKQ